MAGQGQFHFFGRDYWTPAVKKSKLQFTKSEYISEYLILVTSLILNSSLLLDSLRFSKPI